MGDWIGLGFFILLVIIALITLKVLSKPRKSTEEEFEREASRSKTMLGAGFGTLSEMLNPSEAKGKEAITELKKGRYNKKQGQGKSVGEETEGDKK